MPFNPVAFALVTAATRDMEDRAKAAQFAMVGALMGNNMAGVAVLAAAAKQADKGDAVTAVAGPRANRARRELPEGRPQWVEVPALDVEKPEEAEEVMRLHGLVPRIETAISTDSPAGEVTGTVPPPGTAVRPGSDVTVLVSAGVPVPDVVQQDYADAEAQLRALGLTAERKDSEKKGKEGTVEKQDPEGGKYADSGTAVTLWIHRPDSNVRELAKS